jgi:DNA-binding NarL/FixJ family response regulator
VKGGSRAVGRDAELAAVGEGLRADAPHPVVICGEAGIGKTTVWEAALERASAAGFRALVARPSESESQLAYSALNDLLADVLDGLLPELPPPRAHMLRVALLLEEPGHVLASPRAVAFAVLDGLRMLVRQGGPVLVAVDDAQWLDPASATALGFALRRLAGGEGIAALLSCRVERGTVVEQFLTADGPIRIELGPLSLGAVLRIVRESLGRSVPIPLMTKIHEASGGNPFYALELARRSVETGALSTPDSLAALARERLGTFPGPTVEALLEVAALADPVAGLVELEPLEPAFAAGDLVTDGERLRFAHPLLRSAVYGAATPLQRRELHRRLAMRVSGEEHARHLGLASEQPSAQVAATLTDAARGLAARGASQSAAELAELALQLSLPEDRGPAVVLAAEYRLHAGDPAGARALLEEFLRGADGDLRARALLLLAWTREDDFDMAARLCRQALAATSDGRLMAEIHGRLAEFALGQGDLTSALEQAGRAVARAERAGDTRLLVRSLSYQAHFQTLAGTVEPGLLERAICLDQALEHPHSYYGPGAMLGLRLMWADRLSEARPHLENACALAAAVGDEVARAAMLVHLAQLETRAGDWTSARGHADEAVLLSEQMGLRQIESGSCSAAAMVAALTGQVEEARATAESGLAASRAAKEVMFEAHNLAVLGFLELSLGNSARADSHLRGLPDLYARMGYGNWGVNPFLPNAIEAALRQDELVRAESFLNLLARAGRDNPWARATALRCRGLIAAAKREPRAAITALEKAAEAHECSQDPFERARTLLALGAALRRGNQRRASREKLEEARGIFGHLGAPLWEAEASQDLASLGGRPPGTTHLTASERRVAELVARGSTNKEAAALLLVSERTVATHLTHIYAKLGLRSRTELAHRLPAGGAKLRASDDAAKASCSLVSGPCPTSWPSRMSPIARRQSQP